MPSTEVPIGKDETFNKLIFESKKFIKKQDGIAHDEIGKNLGYDGF